MEQTARLAVNGWQITGGGNDMVVLKGIQVICLYRQHCILYCQSIQILNVRRIKNEIKQKDYCCSVSCFSGYSYSRKQSCTRNQLSSLDVSRNIALESLDCCGNQLTSLGISNCKEIENLSCDDSVTVTR